MLCCLVLDNIHHLAMIKTRLVHLPRNAMPFHPQCCRRLLKALTNMRLEMLIVSHAEVSVGLGRVHSIGHFYALDIICLPF